MDTTNIFTVTPMSHNIELEAGQEYIGELTVANPANATKDFNYKVTVAPYTVVGDEYSADLLTESAKTQVVDWITIENPTGTLKPNAVNKVRFRISVPETAPAGGQYAALLVSSDDKETPSGGLSVDNVFEIASIIYANIEGETIRDGEVTSNSIPGFVTALPIRVSATFTNNGNAHEIARATLEVRNVFSATPIYPQPGESSALNEVIMPETSHYLAREINGVSPLGIYEITQTIDYIDKTYQLKQIVVVCPIWFMLLTALTITAVVAAIVHRVKIGHRKKRVV